MRVLVTGGTGFIGAGVVRALRGHGHDVVGLARTAAAADHLRGASVEPVAGSLADPDGLRQVAETADAVVHAAFARYGVDDPADAVAVETAGVHAMLSAARPFIYTSGIGIVGATTSRPVAENDPVSPLDGMSWRRQLELDTISAGHGVVVRPGLVYGRAGGFVLQELIRVAWASSVSRYVEPGDNAWPNVHVDDLGELYALALEQTPPSTILHAVSDESTPRSVAEAIGRLIGHPEATAAVSAAQAPGVVPFPDWLTVNQHIDTRRTRALLGWHPSAPSLIQDIEHGSYRALLAKDA